MSTIKSPEWLREKREKKGYTQKELAQAAGLSIPAIAKIEAGERFGSFETWDKILFVLNDDPVLSIESLDFINELKDEIAIYGDSFQCNLFYESKNGNIIFKDYLLDEDMQENFKNELTTMSVLRVTLKEALELFEKQNDLF